jgi:hypothetical protein
MKPVRLRAERTAPGMDGPPRSRSGTDRELRVRQPVVRHPPPPNTCPPPVSMPPKATIAARRAHEAKQTVGNWRIRLGRGAAHLYDLAERGIGHAMPCRLRQLRTVATPRPVRPTPATLVAAEPDVSPERSRSLVFALVVPD